MSSPTSGPALSGTAVAAATTVRATVTGLRDRLVALSHEIHGHAELAFEEHRSSAALCDVLGDAGFAVERAAGGLDTAFTATYGTGELVVGICAEFDALPEIGHACGHNLIASSAVGAALGLAPVADDLGITVQVLGTPAEEHGGGKVLMLEAGLFDGLALALMVHPANRDVHPAAGGSQGVSRHAATYTGRAAHAAAAPHLGTNAADAAVVAQVGIGLLRQQLPGTARVAAFVRDGGQATNIIPERVVVDFEVREFDLAEQRRVRERVLACFEAGALATGCTLEVEQTEPEYAPLVQDPRLAERYAAALRGLGREPRLDSPMTGGSTDMGNVSQHVPSLHPLIGVPGSEHPPHTHGFAAEVVTTAADDTVVDGALALAMTVVDVAGEHGLREALLAEQAQRAPYTARSTR